MEQTKELNYKITFKETGKKASISGDAILVVLRKGKISEITVEEYYLSKKDGLIASELHKSSFRLPYEELSFVWKYMENQTVNQVRPRKIPKPRFKFKKTRFSRVYFDITYDKIQTLISWFNENIERGAYKVPASHHIVHRIEKICIYNWNKVRIEKS